MKAHIIFRKMLLDTEHPPPHLHVVALNMTALLHRSSCLRYGDILMHGSGMKLK